MTLNFSISPNFPAAHLSTWYIINTYLQKKLSINIHLALYDTIDQQRQALKNGEIDIIYANPYDAALIVRELNFKALAKPCGRSDEVVLASKEGSVFTSMDTLKPGLKIATTNDPAINMIANMLLESADIDKDNSEVTTVDSFIIAAKQLLQDKADIAVFHQRDYDSLSKLIKEQLQDVVTSQISLIHHVFAIDEKHAELLPALQQALLEIDAATLEGLAIESFVALDGEDVEFMIDLMDTLE
ncbi:MAG: PhnD/SsuA/transferrin family substrate-binding protein [Sinobacterium sp.]|nr:PhnD/SsuA/transferrin family substrate-binding protein [Sinobacterium sp.]